MFRAALVVIALLVSAPRAMAQCTPGVPSPSTTTLPLGLGIRLVASPVTATATSLASFSITLRDDCNNPIANRTLKIDLQGCTDLTFSQTQPAGVTVDCSLNTVTFMTDNSGSATVVLQGNVADFANPAASNCAILSAENLPNQSPSWVTLGNLKVAAFDLDGVNGIGAHDILNWRCAFGLQVQSPRADYDFSGSVGANDLSILASMYSDPSTSTPLRCDTQPNSAGPAPAAGIAFNLQWLDCGPSGTALTTFGCGTNNSSEKAVLYVASSNTSSQFYAVDVTLSITGTSGTPLPDWWRLDATGCARPSNRLGITSYDGNDCVASISANSSIGYAKYPSPTVDKETYRMTVFFDQAVTLPANQITPLFMLTVNHQKTVGTGACAGCSTPVKIQVASLRFITDPPCASVNLMGDEATVTTDYTSSVYYQGIPTISPTALSASPKFVGQAPQVLLIQGTLIQSGATVLIHKGSVDITGVVQSVAANGLSMVASFDLTAAATGPWDVVLTNPSQSSVTATNAVVVQASTPASMNASLTGTIYRRPGWTVTQRADFTNSGNVTYDGHGWFAYYVPLGIPSVNVSWAGQSVGPPITPLAIGSRALVGVFSIPTRPDLLGPYLFTFTAPAVGTYESQLELFEVKGPLSAPTPVDAIGTVANELIRAQAVAQGKTWPTFSSGFQAAFPAALDDAIQTRIKAFSNTGAPVVAHAVHAELLKAAVDDALGAVSAYPGDVLGYQGIWNALKNSPTDWLAFQQGLPATGAAMVTPPHPATKYPQLFKIPLVVTGSVDPNDKSGPAGAGDHHDIPAGTPLSYYVHFENLATASAAAQTVTVDDILNGTLLDFSTLSLSDITFGTHVVHIPPGFQSYTQDVDLRPAQNLIARVNTTFDPETGLLSWRFRSLDPATLAPTDDPSAGLLPPNVTPIEGEGSVSFTVMPQSGSPDGTTLSNSARIVFDDNPFIDTPVWSNRLDASPPTSAVTGLSATQNALAFQVQWSGSDALSGIASYSIYVSDNGGSYSLWKNNVTTTSDTYTGAGGHSYAFYSVATDQVGNVEAAPSLADASTTVTVGVADSQTLPRRLAIRIAGEHPTRSMKVELALPRAGAGRLEVLDVAGRVVMTRDLSSMAPGWHTIALDGDGDRPPGLYLIRATQGTETVTLKAVHLR